MKSSYRIRQLTVRVTITWLLVMGFLGAPVAAQPSPGGAGDGPGGYPDVPGGAYYAEPVAALAAEGVFEDTGCPEGFCPDALIDRKTMAVWVVRMLDGADPSNDLISRFEDVDDTGFHAGFVERMAELGVTVGCGGGLFCPDDNISRAHMAVFLSRAFNLPEAAPPGFTDVPSDAWYASHVARLAASKITVGCGDGSMFCPADLTTRAQMATFLWRAQDTVEDSRSLEELIIAGEELMIMLVNNLRVSVGVPELNHHPDVGSVARAWSETMAGRGRSGFYHNPSYSAQYPSGWFAAGENIALYPLYGGENRESISETVTASFNGLSNSPGHYRNMVNTTFNYIGVGIAVVDDYVYVTQNFAYYPATSNRVPA